VKKLLGMGVVCVLGIVMVQVGPSQSQNAPRAAQPRGSTDWIYDPRDIVPCGANKCAEWPGTWSDGDCKITNAKLTIQSDGKVSWSSRVREVDPPVFGSNSICVRLSFLDVNNTPVFSFPAICSPSLTDDEDQVWNRDNLGIPSIHFPAIVKIGRRDRC
jgi:hypothetical protein